MSESRFSDAANTAQPRDFMEQSSRPRDTGSSSQKSGQETGSSQKTGQGTGSSQKSDQEGNGGSGEGASGVSDLGAIGQEAVSQAQEQAVKIVSQAREQVTANVKSQTARGAGIATVLSSTLQEAGTQLREQDETAVATYLDQAAGQVEQISAMLENQEYGKLIGTVQEFARRQPVLFFAAAVAVGVVGAKFLRSSAPQGASSQGASHQSGPDAYAGLRDMQGGDESRAGGYA